MAFFEEFGKRVTVAGQKTVQKSKEFSETAKLNSMISDEERKLSELYGQIGKQYVSLHRDDYEDAFTGLMSSVNDSEKKIRLYKKQIVELRGAQRCEKCGAAIQNDASFCSFCGEPVQKPQRTREEKDVCRKCGAHLKKDARFCAFCGTPVPDAAESVKAAARKSPASPINTVSEVEAVLNLKKNEGAVDTGTEAADTEQISEISEIPEIEPTVESVPADRPSYDPLPASSGKRFCPVCHAEVREDYIFCNYCKTRLP